MTGAITVAVMEPAAESATASEKGPTDSQWAAIRECGQHTLVEAGAGTGKTYTVVQRIMYLLGVRVRDELYAEPVTLSDIAAITFTRQAASDLKRDLRRALRKAGRRGDANAVDQARIGTIHGFCSDLVREHALRSGRAPLSGVLEEGEALAWAEGSVRDELLAALETRSVEGLDVLLGEWDTAKVEQWVLRLMRVPDVLARMRDAEHSVAERALIALSRRALARLEHRLAAEGSIDYDRMIGWTRDLLRDEASVRAMLQRRMHTLIIDEFQDTDSAQQEIAYLLAEPGSGRTDTPRLMLVGDPKQSIYRFRGADVTVWSGVRRDFDERGFGRVLRLEDNFRSVPSILSLVENTAGKWLQTPATSGAELADYEVDFHAVGATRAEPEHGCIEMLVVPAADSGKLRAVVERRKLEAEAIAQRMCQLQREGASWRDMALLLRTWSSMDIYVGAMRRAGIPVYALRDDDFLETREVLDLIVALQAIRDPRDDLAVFGFLRSPFVALRDDTLLSIAVNVKRPYARNLGADAVQLPEADAIARAMTLLHELAALRDRIPMVELLDMLLHRTGYMAHLALLGDGGAQAALNVRRFLQMLGSMEESSAGLVLRAIADRRARGDRIPQARLHGEQDDVVLITSIHMAKGLDWPIVVFGDLSAGGRSDYDKLVIGRDALRLGEAEPTAKDQPERWREMWEARERESDAEDKRVAYVALTRPKDRLILGGIPQGTGSLRGSVAERLIDVFPALKAAHDGDSIALPGHDGVTYHARVCIVPVFGTAADASDEALGETLDEALDEMGSAGPLHVDVVGAVGTTAADIAMVPHEAARGLTRHSATELLTFSRCQRRHQLKYVHGIREPQVDGRGGDVLISAVARGQIVHDVLERYEEEFELDALLEDAIGRWDSDAPPPDSPTGVNYRATLADEITRVLALPEYANIANAPGARRELGFLHVLDDGAAMQGAIDLAAPIDDGVTLVDVKTSRIPAADARRKAAEYAPQQDVYVSAASALGSEPVRRFGFVFSVPAAGVLTEFDAEATAAATARVGNTLALLGAEPGRLAENPRECFFCGYRKVRLCPGVPSAAPGRGTEGAGDGMTGDGMTGNGETGNGETGSGETAEGAAGDVAAGGSGTAEQLGLGL
ncbi:hypothetical protein BH23GEM9_BH23GEM9_17440 [soil metagenome]